LAWRAADSASNNLVEAGNKSTDADFLHKMRIALREARESKVCLQKIRLAPLANAARVVELKLEDEADQLCAIFSPIITNLERRLANERKARRRS
jgi:four helix bundle protein